MSDTATKQPLAFITAVVVPRVGETILGLRRRIGRLSDRDKLDVTRALSEPGVGQRGAADR